MQEKLIQETDLSILRAKYGANTQEADIQVIKQERIVTEQKCGTNVKEIKGRSKSIIV